MTAWEAGCKCCFEIEVLENPSRGVFSREIKRCATHKELQLFPEELFKFVWKEYGNPLAEDLEAENGL